MPVAADFERWLQQPNDPLLTTDLGEAALLPAAFRLPGCQTYLGAQVKIGGRAEGLLSCYRFRDRGYGIDEIALVTALAEQIGLMLETQRLRRQAEEMAVLAERQRLARDLHDSVTQSLYSLTLFSRAGREAAADGDTQRLQESLASLEHNTLHALREMRLLLYELRPADLEQRGAAACAGAAAEYRGTACRAAARRAAGPAACPAAQLRVGPVSHHRRGAQQRDQARRRRPCTPALRMRTGGKAAPELVIADDGRGFDPEQNTGGLGLNNMRERAARLHGQISVTSAPGRWDHGGGHTAMSDREKTDV